MKTKFSIYIPKYFQSYHLIRSFYVTENLSASNSGQLKVPDTPDKDMDSVSMGSSTSSLSLVQSAGRPALLDCVELSVHGIDEAGNQEMKNIFQWKDTCIIYNSLK